MTILISVADPWLSTSGLSRISHPEIRIRMHNSVQQRDAEALLRYVAQYISGSGKRIKPSETMLYGYWLLKFVAGDNGILDIWEYDADGTKFVEGASLALTYWREQHDVCGLARSEFNPPRPDQLVVVSEGVLDGDRVKGVRYQSPHHMSGWWLVTDRYDGNIESMKREHLYHLTFRRPDLARYLALPYGFRFDLSHGEDVWFDPEVMEA